MNIFVAEDEERIVILVKRGLKVRGYVVREKDGGDKIAVSQ
jgi:DNA-binding response OmpR family regulator